MRARYAPNVAELFCAFALFVWLLLWFNWPNCNRAVRSPAVLESHVRAILKEGGNQGFIFNLGHGILPPTPVENVRLLVNLVKESALATTATH